jgi:glutamine cyclotransferase
VVLLVLVFAGCGGGGSADPTPVVRALHTEVVAEYPHDPEAFTQGLEMVGGRLFESTGLFGASTIREVDRATGTVIRSAPIQETFFAEGMTALSDGRLVQLTWKAGRAAVWDIDTFVQVDTWAYGGQGWGVCLLDADTLVVSDGSATLAFRSTADFRRLRGVQVTEAGMPVDRLNELECVDGTVWANVWHTDRMVAIDPGTGAVTAVVDASGLPVDRAALGPEDVLNGIAHDPTTGRFLLAGKRWPTLYEVEFVAD